MSMKSMNKISMDVITSAEMAALDANCEFFGLAPLQLMENAGASIASELKKRFSEDAEVVIIAGKGNNGGDALAAARHLRNANVRVILVGRSKDLRTEASRRNWRILSECGYRMDEITDSSTLKALKETLKPDVIIDALLGTGVRGRIREPESSAIDLINESGAFVLAVDVPSGLNPDTGECDKAVHADLTVTFHRAKPGLLKNESKSYVGELVVADIGIPPGMERLAGPGDVRLVLRRREKSSHKGDNGRILIVGGGPFAGAPALSALASLRTGADWVTIATPRNVAPIIASVSPNLIVQPLSGSILTEDDVSPVLNLMRMHDVLVIGMGLGAAEETKRAVKSIIEDEAVKKAVVDADGLYGLDLPLKASKSKQVIITPHAGEFSKMGTQNPPADGEERLEFIREFSLRNRVVTLLKAAHDVISDGKRIKVNVTGNAGMTVGGTGDVLSGITGALFATSGDAFEVATAAAFISGSAGDAAFRDKGLSLLATDVVEAIPAILSAIELKSLKRV
ncbi:MAG: NAD(P)H-hydrate dehydratase [Methanophagales archaeon]|nr:NAD(P)H-hydrate dehydratase [Methanophagales archaeon]